MIRHSTYLIVVQHINGTEEFILLQNTIVVSINGSKDVERVNVLLANGEDIERLASVDAWAESAKARRASCCLLSAFLAVAATEREARLTRRGVWRIMVAGCEMLGSDFGAG